MRNWRKSESTSDPNIYTWVKIYATLINHQSQDTINKMTHAKLYRRLNLINSNCWKLLCWKIEFSYSEMFSKSNVYYFGPFKFLLTYFRFWFAFVLNHSLISILVHSAHIFCSIYVATHFIRFFFFQKLFHNYSLFY